MSQVPEFCPTYILYLLLRLFVFYLKQVLITVTFLFANTQVHIFSVIDYAEAYAFTTTEKNRKAAVWTIESIK